MKGTEHKDTKAQRHKGARFTAFIALAFVPLCNKFVLCCFLDQIFRRAKLPSLDKEGWLRPLRKCREASLAGADGVVGSSHRLSEVERTTPSAPSKERGYLLDGAVTPPLPRRGVLFGCGLAALCLCGYSPADPEFPNRQ
jgi:hypothetical protein